MTPTEARARFEKARFAHLATADAVGVAHLVPIVFALDGDRIVTAVDAKPKRRRRLRRLTNIASNPRVSLMVDRYDEDWTRLWWARAEGRATIVASGAEFDQALQLLRARYPQYETVELVGPAIIVTVDRWSGWSASSR